VHTVDVIIPLFNGARWIRDTLDSVLAQTHQPTTVFVVDDGSTDGSLERVHQRPDVVVLRSPGKGANMARNFGLERSGADFVAFLDQDDLWHPDHLRLLTGALTRHPDAQAAISRIDFFSNREPWYELTDQSFHLWNPWHSFPFIFEDHTTSGMVFKRAKFQSDGGWSVEHDGQADYFAWYRSGIDAPSIKMNSLTFGCRKHDSGWMRQLRQDVLGLLASLIETADDMVEIYLAKTSDESLERFLRRRSAVYHTFYSLIEKLKDGRDDALAVDLENLEETLACETGHFRKLFALDLEYFLENLGENQERTKKDYLLRLIERCPDRDVLLKEALSRLLADADNP
jgi:glycosyltransferase involved in cell wall biosynthesis